MQQSLKTERAGVISRKPLVPGVCGRKHATAAMSPRAALDVENAAT